ncbi:MAG: hypothetical protein HYV27_03485 [Candidatus Hydrogenedentes bacterium]|nr:hypothetical protein [Candidatus Hydrogenedentota bacterium]
MGVVVDADADLAARWRSIHAILIQAGYQGVQNVPQTNGTILPAPKGTLLPKLGVWIMPDNQVNGILEDFLRFLVPSNSELFRYVENCVDRIPSEQQFFKIADKPKAIIHTWLAWQEVPGIPFGFAITKKFLDPRVPEARTLAAWLKALYL